MGSTILTVIVLVVMWVVVLVPMFTRRNDEVEEGAGGLGGAVRMLARRGSANQADADEADTLEVSADTEVAEEWAEMSEVDSSVETELVESAEVDQAVTNEQAEPVRRPISNSRAQMLARRRRTLGTIVMLAIITALLALGWRPRLWIVQVGLDVLLVGYLWWLRQEVRRERARRARRAQRAARGEGVARTEATARDRRPDGRVQRPVRRPAPQPADEVMSDELVEDGAVEETVDQPADEAIDDGRWEPRPVPTPTYVNAAINVPRPVHDESYHGVVQLDDEDPEFSAEFEEDDYPTLEILPPPKAVNG